MQRFLYAISVSTLVLFLASNAVAAPQRPEPVDLPLTFVPNRGQARADIVLLGQSAGFRVAFMRGHALFAFTKKEQGLALALDFVGARRGAVPEGRHVAAGKVNYLLGNAPDKWLTGLPTYEEIVYRELWPGIDMVFRGAEGQLKYEFVVRPGADVSDIRLAYRGAERLSLDASGRLQIGTELGVLTDAQPVSYQTIGRARVPVTSRYRLRGTRRYGFEVERYDPSRILVIDPGLEYSTFLGGNSAEAAFDIAVDSNGSAYVIGITGSNDFPTTPGAFDTTPNGGQFFDDDVFVTKLNPTGTALVYSTYLGGSTLDLGEGIAVDGSGQAYVTGFTHSPNFPTTPGAWDTTYNGGADVFVTKLNAAGSALIYSTLIGGGTSAPNGGTGSEVGSDLAIDAAGNAFIVGGTASADYPTTPGAYDTTPNGGLDMFITKLNPAGSALVYSTVLGTIMHEQGLDIGIDSAGNACITGYTPSPAFPTTAGAFDTSYGGFEDAIVAKLNAAGSALVYSTYLGGSDSDRGWGIAVDSSGNAYVTGETRSFDFPVTPGVYQPFLMGFGDVFVTKLNPSGSALAYSTYLGGSNVDEGEAIALDPLGNAYMIGRTNSANFPTTPDAYDPSFKGFEDVWVAKLDEDGSALLYSTYLGGNFSDDGLGIAVSAGDAYVCGNTSSVDFPTTPDAFATTLTGFSDAFIAKLDIGDDEPPPPVPTTLTLDPTTATNPVGTVHAVKATVLDAAEQPIAGVTVRFSVSGSVSASGSCVTVASGECFFTYAGPAFPGADVISAYADSDGDATFDAGEPAATARKFWGLPPSTAGCKVSFGGRITAANGDKATFGQENYTDHGPATPMKVKATSTQVTVCTSTSATIFGQATIDGAGPFPFLIDVKDLGEPGSSDRYRIRINGYDSGDQQLEGGNVQVRIR